VVVPAGWDELMVWSMLGTGKLEATDRILLDEGCGWRQSCASTVDCWPSFYASDQRHLRTQPEAAGDQRFRSATAGFRPARLQRSVFLVVEAMDILQLLNRLICLHIRPDSLFEWSVTQVKIRKNKVNWRYQA